EDAVDRQAQHQPQRASDGQQFAYHLAPQSKRLADAEIETTKGVASTRIQCDAEVEPKRSDRSIIPNPRPDADPDICQIITQGTGVDVAGIDEHHPAQIPGD